MKRGVFEALFVSALAYTVVASAAMPARAQETVVYPVRPLEVRNVDSLVDKARKSILTALRVTGEEYGRADNDAVDGADEIAYEVGGDTGEDFDSVIVAEPAEDEDTGAVEEAEASGDYTADPVLTYIGTYACTAYCSCSACCGEYSSGYTASGTWATQGRTIACNTLPMGTEVVIDGNTYIVEDTGWSPYGEAWIDIFFDDHQTASDFGLQYKDVYMRY